MLLPFIAYLPAVIGLLSIAFFVVIRGRNILYHSFAFLLVTIATWLFLLFMSTVMTGDTALWLARGAIFVSNFMPYAFLFFVAAFPDRKILSRDRIIGFTVPTAAFCALSFSSDMITAVGQDAQGLSTVIETGFLYTLQTVYVIAYFLIGFLWLARKLHRVTGHQRQSIYLLFIAFLFPVIVNFLVGYIFITVAWLQVFAPISVLVTAVIVTYAIVKHQLFDLRLAIARTLTYLLLLFALTVFYASVVFGVTRLFLADGQLSSEQSLLFVISAVFLAFTYLPLKRFFGRLTRSIFFQDVYDTKHVLDEIGTILVRTVTVDKSVIQSLTALNKAIKLDFAAVAIFGDHKVSAERILVVGRKAVDLKQFIYELSHHSQSLLVLDEMDDQSDFRYQTMRQNNVAVVARLETSKEIVGYLLLGYKVSGSSYTNQDVGLIKIVADELSVAIQNALRFEEIARFNETLQHEVDVATQKLRASNRKLQALDEAKDEFISMASHQLRTPLTSVKGYLSMALEGDGGALTKDQRKLLQEAYASSQRMVYMIADFLNVSRLKTGKFILEPSTVELPQIIKEEIDQLGAAATARGLTIQTNLASDFPPLQLDENKMRQVVMNFIDNAIFYSKSGGTITINLTKEDDDIAFTVIDHGIGVPAAEQPQVFTKFFRASNAKHARPDGTGIGLFMAKKVITAHGGKVIFTSEEGKGSTFGFRLPIDAKLEDQVDGLNN